MTMAMQYAKSVAVKFPTNNEKISGHKSAAAAAPVQRTPKRTACLICNRYHDEAGSRSTYCS